MSNPVAKKGTAKDGDVTYETVWVWCPGCELLDGHGLHMIPVTDTQGKRPQWTWNGSLEKPGFEPSILTRMTGPDREVVCHSFLREGVWDFLNDSTHALAGQQVSTPPLPDWVIAD